MKVVINSITGQMGRILKDEVLKDNDFTLTGGITSKNIEINDVRVYHNLEDIDTDVIIDFSHPSKLKDILKYGVKNNVALVLATTNYKEEDFKMIIEASKSIPIIYCENYSIGIYSIIKSLEVFSNCLSDFDTFIIEKHHKHKLDQPSGTAKKIKKELMMNKIDNVNIYSIRSGNIPGTHTIIFNSEDEEIEITHRITSKKVFALGALKAAKFIYKKPNGLYTMDDLLGGI